MDISLSRFFGKKIYIQIWSEKIKITNLQTYDEYEYHASIILDKNNKKKPQVYSFDKSPPKKPLEGLTIEKPFKHPRCLLGNFHLAILLLNSIFVDVDIKNNFIPSYFLVHPMEKTEGGLTAVEMKGFVDLLKSLGAKKTFIIHEKKPTITRDEFKSIIDMMNGKEEKWIDRQR